MNVSYKEYIKSSKNYTLTMGIMCGLMFGFSYFSNPTRHMIELSFGPFYAYIDVNKKFIKES